MATRAPAAGKSNSPTLTSACPPPVRKNTTVMRAELSAARTSSPKINPRPATPCSSQPSPYTWVSKAPTSAFTGSTRSGCGRAEHEDLARKLGRGATGWKNASLVAMGRTALRAPRASYRGTQDGALVRKTSKLAAMWRVAGSKTSGSLKAMPRRHVVSRRRRASSGRKLRPPALQTTRCGRARTIGSSRAAHFSQTGPVVPRS